MVMSKEDLLKESKFEEFYWAMFNDSVINHDTAVKREMMVIRAIFADVQDIISSCKATIAIFSGKAPLLCVDRSIVWKSKTF